ncbi:MAG TPA: gliding motility-associated C-terminal domain-containing protein [Saprospiraceae bacterium]|nr:gliding motility-associated C-terminal domain-containing protein [Saprospiraceae bacterium]
MHLRNSWILLPAFLCLAQWMQAQCPTSGNVTVTSNADAGTNTLRWAIDCINTVTPLTTIVFNIPAAGVQTISLTGSLPAITKPNALIDGMAIESAVIDGNLISALGEGIVISASNVTVRGLSLTRFNSPAPGGSGIRISGDNATVNNNYLYNNRIGIIVRDISPTGMVDPAVAPLIRDNFIGETASGAASGNSAQGILFENAPSSAIVRNNVISHNGSNGVRANATGGTLRITENSMFCNAAVGIFRLLSPAAPTITEANTQRIRGTASGGNLIEIFTYNDAGCAPTDPCQGRTLLGTTTANALGFWTLNLSAGAVMPGTLVTATRTAGGNDTYAFAGCSAIADCSGFSVSITPTSITCNGESNGQLTASAPGGSSTTYAWSTGATTPTITGLGPGTYSVTATDAAGCTATASHTLSNPPLLTVGMSGTNITCNGAANGTATATPAGGTPNYQYTWSNGGNSATISNLGPGTYFVTVADANLCRAFGSVSITQPAALSISCAELNPTSTVGGSDGRATVQISGGTAGYTVAWSGAASGSQNQAAAGTATITGLLAGNYTVNVIDANGCQQTCNFSIGSPNCNITLQISGTNPTCNGGANGSINLVVSGATGSLNFDWNVNALDGQPNPTGLSAGTYSVTVTDAANCTASTSISLTQPAALSLVCAQLNPVSVIGGSDGRATVQISGGTAGYTVAWSGAASGSQNQAAAGTATITGLLAGNYTVNVIDANGCQQTCNFSIGSPNCNITLQISGTNPTCNGGANGSINLVVSGATGSLNFDWNVNALDGQQNPTGLIAGTYSVTVTDAGGCTATRSINLTDPPALQLNVSATPETTAGVNDGTATAAATGGTGGYTFAWNNGGNTPTISGLAPGNYSVTVTDGNQCTISGSASVAAGQGGGGACVAQPVYAVAAPARVCQGDTIRLEADDLYPSPNVRYVWFIPNGDSLTTVLPRVGILAASGAYGGQYFALRDSSGCRSIRVGGAPVQVQSLPDDAATVAMLDTVLCAAGTVTLRALPALGGTGRWLPLNAATVDNAASEQTLARNLQRGPNRFVWQVSLEGCAFSAADTVTVTVEAPPVLNDDRYTLQRVQDVLVMEVLLNDNLSGLPDTVLSYLGGPAVGQLELLDGRRFRYTVTEDFRGRVSFQYVVCNPGARCGTACDTATVTIEVLNMPAVPGGLIVDDPGLNGQLTIKGLNGFSRVEMQIFSRWGDLVFEEKQYDNGNPWRGHAHRSGNALPEGAYYYVLRAFDGNVQVGEAQRGVVHLFR